jgi:hypothetical protein
VYAYGAHPPPNWPIAPSLQELYSIMSSSSGNPERGFRAGYRAMRPEHRRTLEEVEAR